jgi:hypothetical protein
MPARPLGGALSAGLILIIIGVIFLLENFNPSFSLWSVVRYWPVILILIGLRRLYDYFAWPEIPPPPHQAESRE